MYESKSPFAAGTPRPGSRLLAILITPPRQQRTYSLTVISAMIAGIGWIDYVSGARLSLQWFYLLPITLAVAWLGLGPAIVAAFCCMVIRLWGDIAWIHHMRHPLTRFWNGIIEFGTLSTYACTLHAFISVYRELEARIAFRTAALKKLMDARDHLQSQLYEVSRQERGAIGRDLHDGLGQHLTATRLAADLLASHLAKERSESVGAAKELVAMIQESITKTRAIAKGLLLAAIPAEELLPELEELANQTERRHRVACEFKHRGEPAGLSNGAASHLFYIAQEAVSNAVRHGKPQHIEIILHVDADRLLLRVIDDGRGFAFPNEKNPGMGLRIMEHRAYLISGTFRVSSDSQAGTSVECSLPLCSKPAILTA